MALARFLASFFVFLRFYLPGCDHAALATASTAALLNNVAPPLVGAAQWRDRTTRASATREGWRYREAAWAPPKADPRLGAQLTGNALATLGLGQDPVICLARCQIGTWMRRIGFDLPRWQEAGAWRPVVAHT